MTTTTRGRYRRLARDQHDQHHNVADDPCANLLIAVIRHAHRDALSANPARARDALRYFFGPNFTADADALGLNPDRVRDLLAQEIATRENGRFTDDTIRRIHGQYMSENLTLDAAGRRHATTGPTLSALFRAMNLPVRPPGRPRRPAQSTADYQEN